MKSKSIETGERDEAMAIAKRRIKSCYSGYPQDCGPLCKLSRALMVEIQHTDLLTEENGRLRTAIEKIKDTNYACEEDKP